MKDLKLPAEELQEEKAPKQEPSAGENSARSLFEPVSLLGKGLLPEDLPYASEYAAALARTPKREARMLSAGVCLFFLIFALWASFATIDEVTHAEGQVIASSRTQIIQNLEGGILQSIDVHEGQIVEKNEILARIDNELAASTLRDVVYKAMENLTAIARLRALVRGDEKLVWPDNLAQWLSSEAGTSLSEEQLRQGRQLLRVQEETFAIQRRQRHSELEVLESQAEQKRQEVKEQLSKREQLSASLRLIQQQMSIAAPLLQKRSYSRVQYLELEARAVQARGEIEGLDASIPKAKAAAREAEQHIALRNAELDAALIEEMNKRSVELASLKENLNAGQDRVVRTELRSPVRGTVKQIIINTVGGVVKPGESIMEIVPLDDTLLIEARVKPADVAFLHHGQHAMVKISAYDFSIYGGLEGVVEQLSADTIEDKQGNFYYLVKVRTNKTSIEYRGENLYIMPGMMTTVDILTGKKTIMDYLLKPVFKARQNALREK
ncbi:MAG: HlyD family type I secretion periplasmic adaptor subunit [Desulfovibrionaceae bacterium]|nr:HlyD family type I secretion periplasmic adaptor subunit [Desulfovibrionaceae bacterium]